MYTLEAVAVVCVTDSLRFWGFIINYYQMLHTQNTHTQMSQLNSTIPVVNLQRYIHNYFFIYRFADRLHPAD